MRARDIFRPTEILLPDFSRVDGTRWATVACDQYTSQPDYWERVARFVGDAPSSLRLMLPELYLSESDSRIPQIHRAMEKALNDLLIPYPDSMILVERTQADGRVRRGIVGAVDLEAYDFRAGAVSPIRATEGTVLERIPPRVRIRRNAPLEMPHVILLFDDPRDTVFGSLLSARASLPLLYDFDLMENGGHLRGYRLDADRQAALTDALDTLTEGQGSNPLLFAVGDGNHSLATAKTAYEEVKAALGADAARSHPARYALVEIENIHDPALDFEPIYRVVTDCDTADFLSELGKITGEKKRCAHTVRVITESEDKEISFLRKSHALTVGTLQNFIDDYMEKHPGVKCDYIHDEDALIDLAKRKNSVGFIFGGMKKNELFPYVQKNGTLPRKTFSMGEARSKRYYIEARKITK